MNACAHRGLARCCRGPMARVSYCNAAGHRLGKRRRAAQVGRDGRGSKNDLVPKASGMVACVSGRALFRVAADADFEAEDARRYCRGRRVGATLCTAMLPPWRLFQLAVGCDLMCAATTLAPGVAFSTCYFDLRWSGRPAKNRTAGQFGRSLRLLHSLQTSST